jgi:transposase
MKILALDCGKNKSVALVSYTGNGPKEYSKIPTTPSAIHDLLVEHKPDVFVLEVGSDAGWIWDIASSLEIKTKVANTNDERWNWKKTKKKSDRKDALRMAQMTEMGDLPEVHMPVPRVRQWRSLINYRHSLVDRRTAVKNSIRAMFERQGQRLPPAHKAWTVAGMAEWRKETLPLEQCPMEQLWRGELHQELEQLESLAKSIEAVEKKLDELALADERIKQLKTAPCVGPRLSELVVATLDDAKRFRTGKQVGAYAGLTPRQWQSGEKCVEGHISRAGNRVLREVLVEVSWLGIRTNAWMKQVYEDVRRGSDKRKKIAIVAVARRLLVRLWAMLRDGTTWKEPAPRATAGGTAVPVGA